MKHHFYFFALLLVLPGFAQQNIGPAPGVYQLFNRDQHEFEQRDIVWQEDFSSGLANWQSEEAGGIANWEYRGPNTNPNVEIGSRGSCAAPGFGDDPILSPTATNGFVIFDSNWWDNSSLPCSPDNYGTGQAPAPHYATLTSPTIDLSAHPNIALVFHQYLKRFSGDMRVEVSSDDGLNWIPVFSNPASLNQTLPNDEQYIQVSAFAGGSAQAKIRFVFDGFYYFWQLDDICLVDTYANDLTLRNCTYGDFDLYDPSHPTGFEFMEYTKYPVDMPPLLKFSGICDNVGSNAQVNVKLQVDVQSLDGINSLHSAESAEGTFMFSGMTSELRTGTFQMPGEVGDYRVLFETNQDAVEEFEDNNRDTAVFFIDETQYARDALFTTAVYLGLPEYENTQYEIGNVFLVTAPDLTCHSITVAVGLGSSTPTNIYGALYSIDISNSIDVTLLGTTQPIAISAEMFNGYADQILTNLTFDSPIAVEEGSAYFVAVGTQDGIGNFVCAMAGNAYEQTSFVRFFPADWFYLDRIPMVRMNFGFFNQTEELDAIIPELSIYPVPAKDNVIMSLLPFVREDVRIDVIDQGGRIVQSIHEKNLMTANYELDISGYAEGIYQVFAHNTQRSYSGRFIKQ
jgi:hypothetical protein